MLTGKSTKCWKKVLKSVENSVGIVENLFVIFIKNGETEQKNQKNKIKNRNKQGAFFTAKTYVENAKSA